MLPSLLVAAALIGLQATQTAPSDSTPKKLTIVNADGCIDGRSLKMARPSGIDDAELIVNPVYRLKAAGQLQNDIKALNGKPVRVRGQLNLPGPATTMIGNMRLGIGTGPDDPMAPTVTRAPEPQVIEVITVTAIDGTCDASGATANAAARRPSPAAPPHLQHRSAPVAPAAPAAPAAPSAPRHYMFVWTGDSAQKGNDFLAVIDADPSSPSVRAAHDHRRDRPADDERASHRVRDAGKRHAVRERSRCRPHVCLRSPRSGASEDCDVVHRHGRLHAPALLPAAAERERARQLSARASHSHRREGRTERRACRDRRSRPGGSLIEQCGRRIC